MTKKKLGFWSIILLTINSIVGSGIFLSPSSVVKLSGTEAPLIYLVAAIFAIILAITFASAAKYVSRAGAAYAYAKAAFGDNLGFYVGITRYVSASIAWGVMATAVVKTVISIFGGDSTSFSLTLFGVIILMLIMILANMFGNKVFAVINNLSTIGKMLALIVTIVVGVILLISSGENHMAEINNLKTAAGTPMVPTSMTVSTFVMAMVAAFYAYTGFESVATASDDMEKPEKDLPRAIPLAIFIIAIVYTGIILVALMINPTAMVTTKSVVALSAIFDNVIIRNVILVGAFISMFGINVAASFATPRVLEAIAKEKQVPQWFVKRTARDFPLRAMILTMILAVLIPMAFQFNMTNIIVLSSIARFIQFLVVPIAVIAFYYGHGKKKAEILVTAKKQFFTDVICPILAFVVTIFLLAKFDWKGQFTLVNAKTGQTSTNFMGIWAILIGFVFIPILLFVLMKIGQSREKKEA